MPHKVYLCGNIRSNCQALFTNGYNALQEAVWACAPRVELCKQWISMDNCILLSAPLVQDVRPSGRWYQSCKQAGNKESPHDQPGHSGHGYEIRYRGIQMHTLE